MEFIVEGAFNKTFSMSVSQRSSDPKQCTRECVRDECDQHRENERGAGPRVRARQTREGESVSECDTSDIAPPHAESRELRARAVKTNE